MDLDAGYIARQLVKALEAEKKSYTAKAACIERRQVAIAVAPLHGEDDLP
jgi:hypothetical protein